MHAQNTSHSCSDSLPADCQGNLRPFINHPSTLRCQTGLKKEALVKADANKDATANLYGSQSHHQKDMLAYIMSILPLH